MSFSVVSDVHADKSSLPPFSAEKVCVACVVSAGIVNSVRLVAPETAIVPPIIPSPEEMVLPCTPVIVTVPDAAITEPFEPVAIAGIVAPEATFKVPLTTIPPVAAHVLLAATVVVAPLRTCRVPAILFTAVSPNCTFMPLPALLVIFILPEKEEPVAKWNLSDGVDASANSPEPSSEGAVVV